MDLRDTQGGDASQLVAEKLARRITGWYVSRHEQPSTYPAEAPRGPIVAITDEYASSGGDIVIQALKSYGIATVVGTRTWGGVISFYFNELVDGTLVTQPTSALWFADVGCAVDPDVEVTIAPVLSPGAGANVIASCFLPGFLPDRPRGKYRRAFSSRVHRFADGLLPRPPQADRFLLRGQGLPASAQVTKAGPHEHALAIPCRDEPRGGACPLGGVKHP